MLKLTISLLLCLSFSLNEDVWAPCTDNLSEFECRDVHVPKLYEESNDPKAEGTLKTMHRRLVVGEDPDKYIFLISGGPGGNADVVTYAAVPQLKEAFPEGNFIVHIPSLRGTANTDHIPVYDGFPEGLQEKVEESGYLPEFFTPTNSAKDIIAAVLEAKQQWPGLSFHAMGFSYGTFQLQRVLEIEPQGLFESVILDGSLDSILSNNLFEFQQAGLGPLTERIEENCQYSEFCRTHSLSRSELAKFMDEIKMGATNECLDWVIEQVSPGAPGYEIVSTAINSLAMAGNIEIPASFLNEDPTLLENQKKFVEYAINTFNGNFGKEGHIYMDMRVYYWSFLNQLAQCPSLETFQQGAGFVMQIMGMAGALMPYMLSAESPLGNTYVTQILNLAAENMTNLAVNEEYINIMQSQGPIRTPTSMFQSQKQLVEQVEPLAPAPEEMSEYVGTSPIDVNAHIVFLTGLLDPNVPFDQTLDAFDHLQVNEQGKKDHFIHTNAGHTVIGLGYSKCSPKLMRGIVDNDQEVLNEYIECLNEENNKTLEWEALDVKELLGYDIWNGIPVKQENKIKEQYYLIFLLIAVILLGVKLIAGGI